METGWNTQMTELKTAYEGKLKVLQEELDKLKKPQSTRSVVKGVGQDTSPLSLPEGMGPAAPCNSQHFAQPKAHERPEGHGEGHEGHGSGSQQPSQHERVASPGNPPMGNRRGGLGGEDLHQIHLGMEAMMEAMVVMAKTVGKGTHRRHHPVILEAEVALDADDLPETMPLQNLLTPVEREAPPTGTVIIATCGIVNAVSP